MSKMLSNPTSLLHKNIVVSFEGYLDDLFVEEVTDEMIVCSSPDLGHAELYFENHGEWKIVEIKDSL